MASQTEAPFVLSDVPLNKKRISELQGLASQLGLDHAGLKKKNLFQKIQKHLRDTPGVADEPRFLPLLAHRTTSKTTGKTSAEKSQEDRVESSKTAEPATGANKTLLENKIKIDPPAQFTKLKPRKAESESVEEDSSSEDEDSKASEEVTEPARTVTPEPDVKAPAPVTESKTMKPLILNFRHPENTTVAPRSILIEDFPVSHSTAPDGTQKFTALLSELLPAALQNDSPMKESRARVFRAGVRGDAGHHYLGSVDKLLAGTANSLKPAIMNEFQLHASDDGTLIGDLFLAPASERDKNESDESGGKKSDELGYQKIKEHSPTTESNAQGDLDAKQLQDKNVNSGKGYAQSGDVSTGRSDDKKPEPLKFTGNGSDVPLEIAKDRAKHDPMNKDADPADRDHFISYLHQLISAAVPDLPALGGQWPRANEGAVVLDRKLKQDKIVAFLGKWGRTSGGYTLPRDDKEYPGIHFEKKFIFDALGLRSSRTSEIDAYFSSQNLKKAPKVREWFESGGKTHASKFDRMKTADFEKYLKSKTGGTSQRKEKTSRRRRRSPSSSSASEAPTRKHRKAAGSSSDDDDRISRKKGKGKQVSESSDEEERVVVKKKSKKTTEKPVITSEDMD